MSKGSAVRPYDKAKFDTNFDRIFGKSRSNTQEPKKPAPRKKEIKS